MNQALPDNSTGRRIVNIAVMLALVGLSAAIFANAMGKPLGRDEQMYCTAGVLVSQGKAIYRDFSYAAQLPCHPLICAAIYRISGTSHYLLAGRLLSAACDIGVMLCIFSVFGRLFEGFATSGALLGLAGAVLYVFNPAVDYANGYAWNHDVVMLCVALSFRLFVGMNMDAPRRHARLAAIGALVTFASCMRITTVMAELAFLCVLLLCAGGSWKQRYKAALPFLAASGIVLVWPVWVVARAPRAFYLNLVKIPVLYGRWLREKGMVHDKLELSLMQLREPGYFALLSLVACLVAAVVLLRRRLKVSDGSGFLLAGLLTASFFAVAWIPPTMWRQYLAMPVPFLVVGLAYPLLYLRRGDGSRPAGRFKVACVLVGACVFVVIASNGIVAQRLPLTLVPELWTPVELHQVSQQIGRRLAPPRLVLTLGPLFALEGGCSIYEELSAGAIIYRAADRLSPAERDVTHTVGPGGIKELIRQRRPSAVITGIEQGVFSELEKPLLEAVGPGWQEHRCENGLTLFFRP